LGFTRNLGTRLEDLPRRPVQMITSLREIEVQAAFDTSQCCSHASMDPTVGRIYALKVPPQQISCICAFDERLNITPLPTALERYLLTRAFERGRSRHTPHHALLEAANLQQRLFYLAKNQDMKTFCSLGTVLSHQRLRARAPPAPRHTMHSSGRPPVPAARSHTAWILLDLTVFHICN
jgi:hypothetical protein